MTNELAQLVAATRKRRGLTLDAVRGEISAAAFSRFERGETEIKSSRLTGVFERLGISYRDLLAASAISEFNSDAYVKNSLEHRLERPAYLTAPAAGASRFIQILDWLVQADGGPGQATAVPAQAQAVVWTYLTDHELAVLDWRLLLSGVRFLDPPQTLALLERLRVRERLAELTADSAIRAPMLSVVQILWETSAVAAPNSTTFHAVVALVAQLGYPETTGAMFAVHRLQIDLRTRALTENSAAARAQLAWWVNHVEPLVIASTPESMMAYYYLQGFLTPADYAAGEQLQAQLERGGGDDCF